MSSAWDLIVILDSGHWPKLEKKIEAIKQKVSKTRFLIGILFFNQKYTFLYINKNINM